MKKNSSSSISYYRFNLRRIHMDIKIIWRKMAYNGKTILSGSVVMASRTEQRKYITKWFMLKKEKMFDIKDAFNEKWLI